MAGLDVAKNCLTLMSLLDSKVIKDARLKEAVQHDIDKYGGKSLSLLQKTP